MLTFDIVIYWYLLFTDTHQSVLKTYQSIFSISKLLGFLTLSDILVVVMVVGVVQLVVFLAEVVVMVVGVMGLKLHFSNFPPDVIELIVTHSPLHLLTITSLVTHQRRNPCMRRHHCLT